MADGGSISLRLSLKGAEQVKAALGALGPVGANVGRQLEAAMRQPGAGMLALNAASIQARTGLTGLAANAGSAGTVLSAMGVAGLGAAAALGAVVVALREAGEAAAFAEGLKNAANAAHVSTDTLQELRGALVAAGGSAEGADLAMQAFSVTLGNAQGGVRRAVAVFKSIGFTQAEIDSWRDSDTAIRAVTERLEGFTDQARDAFLSRSGLTSMAPLINQGAAAMERLRHHVREIGLVMDASMIQRGAAVHSQFEEMSQVIDIQLKSALIDLAPVLDMLLGLVGRLATAFGGIADNLRSIETRTTRTLLARHQELQGQVVDDQALLAQGVRRTVDLDAGVATDIMGAGPSPVPITTNQAGIRARIAAATAEMTQIQGVLSTRDALNRPAAATRTDLNAPAGTSSNSEAEARARRSGELIAQAQERELQARTAITTNLEDLQALQLRAVDLATTNNIAQIRLDLSQGRITQAAADHAIAAERAAALSRTTLIERQNQHEADQRWAADQQSIAQDYNTIAGISEGMARSASERRAIELRTLDAAHRLEIATLEAARDAEVAADPSRASQWVARLESVRGRQASEVNQVRFNTRGPWEEWRDSAIMSAGQVQDALEQVGVDGIEALNRSLIDNEGHFRNWRHVASDVLSQVMSDFLRLELRVLESHMFETLQGGGSPGGGGEDLISNIVSFGMKLLGGGGSGGGHEGAHFAKGGILDRPTSFKFGEGGAFTGLGGEAGTEGLFPLVRGPDGRLGVIDQGGGSRGGNLTVNYTNIFDAKGADPQSLSRLALQVDNYQRAEPERFASYLGTLRRAGYI